MTPNNYDAKTVPVYFAGLQGNIEGVPWPQIAAGKMICERPCSPVVARQLGQPAINLIRMRREDGHWVSSDGVPLLRGAGPARAVLFDVAHAPAPHPTKETP